MHKWYLLTHIKENQMTSSEQPEYFGLVTCIQQA